MVTGITDENGWQEIHQVTHTHPHTPLLHWWLVLFSSDSLCVGVFVFFWCSGVSLWQRAALGAPAVLRCRHEFPECLRKHGAAPVCLVQPGNTHTHAGMCVTRSHGRVDMSGVGSAGQLRPGSAVQRSQQGHKELQQPDGLSGENKTENIDSYIYMCLGHYFWKNIHKSLLLENEYNILYIYILTFI